MSGVAIQVENISKMYRLGGIGSKTISEDLNRSFARMLGKEDPYAKIGASNDRLSEHNSDYVWSLKNINFEVNQGDALGIIGKNGAGKSTLLKILSRVTGPTSGSIKIKGRVASLLEVGTGFHPDLSGRDNIYMNGAILGMNRTEIRARFDEIVDFSGVGNYIDTPVKRYSSGMYVRLAFAVAAHLEPDILIVDEVLAVGDAEFQKKCLGKMQDVNKKEGRTILFVSHNMAAVSNFCKTSILMEKGTIAYSGLTRDVINTYFSAVKINGGEVLAKDIQISAQNDSLKFIRIALIGNEGISNTFGLHEDIVCEIEYEVIKDNVKVVPSIRLLDKYGEGILSTFNAPSANIGTDSYFGKIQSKGIYKTQCVLPKNFLNDTQYFISAYLSSDINFSDMTVADEVMSFQMIDTGEMRLEYTGNWNGQIRPKLQWS
ncbi:MAG TPA: polysaccharide ABC transporter ATP-binding protein, partial [Cytophaga sp.]|nr:polysaccharide ABC transporter ATP-binding protein [Cytophaga sp.]